MNLEQQFEWLEKEYKPCCLKVGKLVPYEYRRSVDKQWRLVSNGFPFMAPGDDYRLPTPQIPKETIYVNGIEYVKPLYGRDLSRGKCWYSMQRHDGVFHVCKGMEQPSSRLDAPIYFAEEADALEWVSLQKILHGVKK